MSHLSGVSQWSRIVSSRFPHLSRPQAWTLTLWSLGIVISQRAGLRMVSVLLAALFGRTMSATRGQLREWYLDAADKQGAKHGQKRRALEVTTCFAPLLRWVVALHPPATRTLALAMDASTLGQRFTVLSIHVVIRGCAIPVAWKLTPATAKGAWRPHWEALFAHLHESVPADWTVIVLADRGLYAAWLFTTIVRMGWHPFLRINRQGKFRPVDEADFRGLSTVVVQGERGWKGRVVCFSTKERQIHGTLLAHWVTGYRDPWLILTDLPPERAEVAWYGLRAWIECSYKDFKRGGWHWEQTKMRTVARAERIWLALAVATVFVVSVGVADEAATPTQVDALPATHISRRRATGVPAPRTISCFHRGRLLLLAALIQGRVLPPMALIPEPWPKSLDTPAESAPPHPNAPK